MRPESLHGATGSNLWRTPIPYLFGGLAAMMVAMAIALIVLACSRSNPSSDGDPESPSSMGEPAILPLDMEPMIAVTMAGDDDPTFLAKPVSLSLHTQQQASDKQ